MIRELPGTFQIYDQEYAFGAVIADGPGFAGTAASIHTPGSQVAQKAQIQPSINRPWIVYGCSFRVALMIQNGAWDPAQPSFGRLPNLIGGLVPDPEGGGLTLNRELLTNFKIPQNALPFTDIIFNGDTDPIPPQTAFQPNYHPLQVVHQLNLPQPLRIESTQGLAVGLWITPTIIANTAFLVTETEYELTYDDNG